MKSLITLIYARSAFASISIPAADLRTQEVPFVTFTICKTTNSKAQNERHEPTTFGKSTQSQWRQFVEKQNCTILRSEIGISH